MGCSSLTNIVQWNLQMCGRTPIYGHENPTSVTLVQIIATFIIKVIVDYSWYLALFRLFLTTIESMDSYQMGGKLQCLLFSFFFDHKRLPNLRMNQGIGFVYLSCSPHVVGFIVQTCDPHVIGLIMQICDVFISMHYG